MQHSRVISLAIKSAQKFRYYRHSDLQEYDGAVASGGGYSLVSGILKGRGPVAITCSGKLY